VAWKEYLIILHFSLGQENQKGILVIWLFGPFIYSLGIQGTAHLLNKQRDREKRREKGSGVQSFWLPWTPCILYPTILESYIIRVLKIHTNPHPTEKGNKTNKTEVVPQLKRVITELRIKFKKKR
jgi:hypothetical protein